MTFPISPWLASFTPIEKDGVPTDDNVAEILDAIIPLFPTPQITTLDLHLLIALTASLKDLLSEFFNFFKALICKSITFFLQEVVSFKNSCIFARATIVKQ